MKRHRMNNPKSRGSKRTSKSPPTPKGAGGKTAGQNMRRGGGR